MSNNMGQTIIFETPAKCWEEALPVGNGKLGGMVFGLPYTERIQLNEDSVWFGGPQDRNNPSALENLPKIRSLIMEGRIREAQELCTFALSGLPEEQRHYEPLGNLYIEFDGQEMEYSGYSRTLDLATATVTTSYVMRRTIGGKTSDVRYTHEVIASFPQNAMKRSRTRSRRYEDSAITASVTASRESPAGFRSWRPHPAETVCIWPAASRSSQRAGRLN